MSTRCELKRNDVKVPKVVVNVQYIECGRLILISDTQARSQKYEPVIIGREHRVF